MSIDKPFEGVVRSPAVVCTPAIARGEHRIRINDQWRICFIWCTDSAYEVEIVDGIRRQSRIPPLARNADLSKFIL
jgi:hypothetical protein